MITGYFGLPRSGKTTILTSIAVKTHRKMLKGKSPYKRIYSNFDCPFSYKIEFINLKDYIFEDCLILLDEVTIYADNRNFKSFPQGIVDFLMLHGHYNCDIIYFSQNYSNVDKKIRDVTYDLYYVQKCRIPCFSRSKRIFRTLDINEQTHEIVNGYRFCNFFESILGYFGFDLGKLYFRPRWYKYFDSFNRPLDRPMFESSSWRDDIDF